MRRREFLAAAAMIPVAWYTKEVITTDPYPDAVIENPNLLEVAIAKLTRPIMVRFATSKYTHDTDWDYSNYLPEFAGIQFTWIPGDPKLKERRHGIPGLIDSITISLGAWPNKIDLTPDRADQRWRIIYREGLTGVREDKLGFTGTQSVIQGNAPYEIAGLYEDGSQVDFDVSDPNPRNSNLTQTHLN